MIVYPHPEGGEVRLNNGHAWRVLENGTEEELTEEEEEAWYARLAEDNANPHASRSAKVEAELATHHRRR